MPDRLTGQEDQRPLAELTREFIMDLESRRDAATLFDRMRREDPVHRCPVGPVMVTEYAASLKVLSGKDGFDRQTATRKLAHFTFEPGEGMDIFLARMTTSDGPDHSRRRGLVNRSFTPRAIAGWRPLIQRVTDDLIDAVESAGRMDLMSQFAYPLPERVICEMIGVPHSDHKLFEEWSFHIANRAVEGTGSDEDKRVVSQAMTDFGNHLRAILVERKKTPGDDLVSQLIEAGEVGNKLTETEIVAILGELISAGHDTTANTIGRALQSLFRNPDQFELLKSDLSLIPAAVEELLRYDGPVQIALSRVATRDNQLAGCPIAEGDVMMVLFPALNHDPAVFSEPHRLDITRKHNPHLGYGAGPHACVGQALARAELQIAFDTLLRRLPGLRLANEDVPWRRHHIITGPSRLEVTW